MGKAAATIFLGSFRALIYASGTRNSYSHLVANLLRVIADSKVLSRRQFAAAASCILTSLDQYPAVSKSAQQLEMSSNNERNYTATTI